MQFRGPDSSHLLSASGQEPLCGPLPVTGRSLEHAYPLLALRGWKGGGVILLKILSLSPVYKQVSDQDTSAPTV